MGPWTWRKRITPSLLAFKFTPRESRNRRCGTHTWNSSRRRACTSSTTGSNTRWISWASIRRRRGNCLKSEPGKLFTSYQNPKEADGFRRERTTDTFYYINLHHIIQKVVPNDYIYL